jgi:hypothetical protein
VSLRVGVLFHYIIFAKKLINPVWCLSLPQWEQAGWFVPPFYSEPISIRSLLGIRS